MFVLGYLGIALEHNIKINKTATALATGVVCWTMYALSGGHEVVEELSHHLGSIAEILFFLMGAMTIVEVVDAHNGFSVITDRIQTRSMRTLVWVIGFITFFLSAALDNLTTTIVMITLLRKLVTQHEQRLMFVGLVVIAANAGGAWSPIGDVTTTMLWIGGQISAWGIIKTLIVPSLLCLIVPLAVMSLRMKGTLGTVSDRPEKVHGSRRMFAVGIGGLLAVPVFKTVTHLPPYMGMMGALAIIWIVGEFIHDGKDEEEKRRFTAGHALQRIDMPSVLFFLGILLAVACLESIQVLTTASRFLETNIGNQNVILSTIGVLSAIVDNVPLVAGAMGMYPLSAFPPGDRLWQMLAYAAGTGGSILIIGSAAGVAAMGMERINFMWYLRRVAPLAALGYFAGIAWCVFFL